MPAISFIRADPAALDRFAAGTGSRTQGIDAAKASMTAAVAAWNRADNGEYGFCLADFGGDVDDLARGWVMTDDFVGGVARAFREADGPGATIGTVTTTQSAVDRAMATSLADYNPLKSTEQGDMASWLRLTGAARCFAGGKYLGGGFITAPDGKRYPLVVIETKDGKNADDGGPGDVTTLDGSDPGWFRTGLYTGEGSLFATDKTSAAIGGALLGLTGGSGLPNKSASKADYAKLLLDADGRPKFADSGQIPYADKPGLDKVQGYKGSGTPGGPVEPSLTNAAGKAQAALFAINGATGAMTAVNNAEKDAYGKYQLITERNLDGRVRARLSLYQVWKGSPDGRAVIIPTAVSQQDGRLAQQVIRYRPHADIGDPLHDTDLEDDHIFKGLHDKSLFGIFGRWKEPTFQDK